MHKLALQGIAYDKKSSYLNGPALAPALIRKAYHSPSANYAAENGVEVCPDWFRDFGDFEPEDYFEIEAVTEKSLSANLPLLTLGGDHSITYPILRAHHKKYGPLPILHIDAHSDLYPSFEGDPYSHACPFHNIMKEGLASNLVQVGIRTLNSEQRAIASKYGVTIAEMKDYEDFVMPGFSGPIYLSLDIDCLDPAFAPGVSHHEPGGFTTRQLINLLHRIPVPIIGADLVEYNPKRDHNEVTAMVCGKLLKEIAVKMV